MSVRKLPASSARSITAKMRIVVAGVGVQGRKRRKIAGADYVASADPSNTEADYKSLSDVPLNDYDAVLACIPDAPKAQLLNYCVENGKHVLVEKPLWVEGEADIAALVQRAWAKGVIIYTAYNHRFEPHYV